MSAAQTYPQWLHHPRGTLYAKRERCSSCGQQIDVQATGMFTLWTDLITMDTRRTLCEPCAESLASPA